MQPKITPNSALPSNDEVKSRWALIPITQYVFIAYVQEKEENLPLRLLFTSKNSTCFI
jgi:hypothetical protein